MGDLKRGTRGISSAVSTILLTAIVLIIGGGVWAFSQRATTSTTEAYAQATIEMVNTISERFIIEQVSYDEKSFRVWVYNYGEVTIEVNVTYPNNPGADWQEILSGDLERIDIGLEASSGTEVEIMVESRRGNNAQYEFIVP